MTALMGRLRRALGLSAREGHSPTPAPAGETLTERLEAEFEDAQRDAQLAIAANGRASAQLGRAIRSPGRRVDDLLHGTK